MRPSAPPARYKARAKAPGRCGISTLRWHAIVLTSTINPLLLPGTQVAATASAFASLHHSDPALLAALSGVATRSDVLRTMTSKDAGTILRAFEALGCLDSALATQLRPVAAAARGGSGLGFRIAAGVGGGQAQCCLLC